MPKEEVTWQYMDEAVDWPNAPLPVPLMLSGTFTGFSTGYSENFWDAIGAT